MPAGRQQGAERKNLKITGILSVVVQISANSKMRSRDAILQNKGLFFPTLPQGSYTNEPSFGYESGFEHSMVEAACSQEVM